MKRLFTVAAALALGSCAGTPPAPHTFANQWYSSSAQNTFTSLNLHETASGWQGRIAGRPGLYTPIRSITQSADAMSFMVPSLDASFSAKKDGQGWSGQWTAKGVTTPIALTAVDGPNDPTGRFVTLAGGRQMYIDCRGTGSPAVIFDSGAGGNHNSWRGVQDEVAKTTMACTYDRAAHAASDAGPLPRDTAAVADDLDAMLAAAKIPAPYVLVGHSLGSYHVRQYANTRLNKVAGVVLVDPSGDNQQALFLAAIPKIAGIPGMMPDPAKSADCVAKLRASIVLTTDQLTKDCQGNDAVVVEGNASEVNAMPGPSLKELRASHRSYGDLPLIVLTRGDYDKGQPAEFDANDKAAMKKIWTGLHRDMTALSTKGQSREVPNAGHNIQVDQPQAVTAAILEVLAAARAKAR